MSRLKPEKGCPCAGCGQIVQAGQVVHSYEDVGEVHVDCTDPWALSDDPKAHILIGRPMRLIPLAALAAAQRRAA